MNTVDATCEKCGKPAKYDGLLPILCGGCLKKLAEEVKHKK